VIDRPTTAAGKAPTAVILERAVDIYCGSYAAISLNLAFDISYRGVRITGYIICTTDVITCAPWCPAALFFCIIRIIA
jgi:hypothetical protein